MWNNLTKHLFQRLNDKDVIIKIKNFANSFDAFELKGKLIAYYYGQGTDMFLELDNGHIVNTRYISYIKVND